MVRVLALLLFAATASAHPSVSIVIDSRGNVFYSDLSQVWRIAPDGTKSVAVPGVHSHELVLDAADNLYGEHLWYEGEQTNRWGHYVWRRAPDGRITKVIPPTPGFLTNYSFVRDRAGTMYWPDRERGEIRKRTADGRIATVARVPFKNIRWMTAAPDGTLYLVDTVDLARITPRGEVKVLARNLSKRGIRFDVGDHLIMGLWFDPAGNICFADFAGGYAKRVTPAGKVEVIASSALPWSITGGAYARDGSLWLLEWSLTNQVRVRRGGQAFNSPLPHNR